MKVLDPGHLYELEVLDPVYEGQTENLHFVKRVGSNYPGNKFPIYPGVTTQEVLRALIDRTKYVQRQEFSTVNIAVLFDLRNALWSLEMRAIKKRGGMIKASYDYIEDVPTCPKCGHIECQETHAS